MTLQLIEGDCLAEIPIPRARVAWSAPPRLIRHMIWWQLRAIRQCRGGGMSKILSDD